MADEELILKGYNRRQQRFMKYTFLVLIDLVVLGVFNQYWDLVIIKTFTIALLAAVLLQFLMQVALKIEHIVADRLFGNKSSTRIKVMRGISAWAIIFISKLVILEAMNIFFGESVLFLGPIHGLFAFLTVVITIIIVEQLMLWIYRALADDDKHHIEGKQKNFSDEL